MFQETTPLITINPEASPRELAALERVFSTREAWLGGIAESVRPLFASVGATMPDKIRFSCSWPGGTRGGKSKRGVIGQCWYPAASGDGHTEIFISPVLDNPLEVAATLVHELVHACLDVKAGHGPRFAKLALAVGLTGKMTATVAGPALIAALEPILALAGEYPHAMMRAGEAADKPKKQTTRQLKVLCPECIEPYICRMSATTIARGLPTCPCGAEMVAEADQEGE